MPATEFSPIATEPFSPPIVAFEPTAIVPLVILEVVLAPIAIVSTEPVFAFSPTAILLPVATAPLAFNWVCTVSVLLIATAASALTAVNCNAAAATITASAFLDLLDFPRAGTFSATAVYVLVASLYTTR